jgi:4-hydroxybenzoate polyprenyltransferase
LHREFDKHHPTKSRRRAVERAPRGKFVKLEWAAFTIVGLSCAWSCGATLFVTACVFGLLGIVYNVSPLAVRINLIGT